VPLFSLPVFKKKDKISVTIKLFSGIEKTLKIHESGKSGICVKAKRGTRLKHVLKKIGLENRKELVYFRNNIRINRWTRLEDGDVVSCLKISGGG
jgi:hypothetical protein